MLVGETFERVNRHAFWNELPALTVPPIIGLFLFGKDAAASRTEEFNRLIIVYGFHVIHHSITILRRQAESAKMFPQARRGSRLFSGHSPQRGFGLQ